MWFHALHTDAIPTKGLAAWNAPTMSCTGPLIPAKDTVIGDGTHLIDIVTSQDTAGTLLPIVHNATWSFTRVMTVINNVEGVFIDKYSMDNCLGQI